MIWILFYDNDLKEIYCQIHECRSIELRIDIGVNWLHPLKIQQEGGSTSCSNFKFIWSQEWQWNTVSLLSISNSVLFLFVHLAPQLYLRHMLLTHFTNPISKQPTNFHPTHTAHHPPKQAHTHMHMDDHESLTLCSFP